MSVQFQVFVVPYVVDSYHLSTAMRGFRSSFCNCLAISPPIIAVPNSRRQQPVFLLILCWFYELVSQPFQEYPELKTSQTESQQASCPMMLPRICPLGLLILLSIAAGVWCPPDKSLRALRSFSRCILFEAVLSSLNPMANPDAGQLCSSMPRSAALPPQRHWSLSLDLWS